MSQSTDAYLRQPEVAAALLRATRAVLRISEFEVTARLVFDEARAMTGAASGYVALLSDDGHENEVLFLEAGGLPCTVDPNLPMPIRGLRAEAYDRAETVYDNDFMDSHWYELMPEGHVALNNVLFAPLVVDGKVSGIMGLANKQSAFDDRDAAVATAFGEFAALALKNSRTLEQLEVTVKDLRVTLDEVRTLRGIIPICAQCKSVRTEDGYWQQVETYIAQRSEADFSHGLCQKCVTSLYGEDISD